MLPDNAGIILLPIARVAIADALGQRSVAHTHAPWLQEPAASFVTLTLGGLLRGCIGSLEPRRSLFSDVQANAVAAALHDSRFTALPSLIRVALRSLFCLRSKRFHVTTNQTLWRN